MPPGEAPCTQVQCRYHLAHASLGDHHREPTRDCALAVANEGPRSTDEVAAVLGISPNTAASRYRYALTELRDTLGENADE